MKSKGLNPEEKLITITTVTDGNYPSENKLIDRLLSAREEGKLKGYPNFLIRLHPKDTMSKYAHFKRTRNVHVEDAGKRVGVNLGSEVEMDPEDLMNVKYTLMYSDVVINYASTMTLEAFVFDKPVININFKTSNEHLTSRSPTFYYGMKHYRDALATGGIRLVESEAELVEWINRYLADPALDCEGRARLVREQCQFTDGKGGERVGRYVLEQIKED